MESNVILVALFVDSNNTICFLYLFVTIDHMTILHIYNIKRENIVVLSSVDFNRKVFRNCELFQVEYVGNIILYTYTYLSFMIRHQNETISHFP